MQHAYVGSFLPCCSSVCLEVVVAANFKLYQILHNFWYNQLRIQKACIIRCFTPERQFKESGSLSSCSSNGSSEFLDRYIDGEEHLERSKQKSGSSHSSLSGSTKGKRLPLRALL
ncbi:hypothetical protein ARALYDRAFT_903172 [Arabidopsis lyrata subsp. lyrata]|uniref:Uncharacterized protein n=1 Tax=Arabidopsis lyrata subsp. lyrata TaxID=81972 RepID=D7LD28_ARALL|nr:hypothetical protein ARALYDRAFT_903172 [Arabidopsis lyrata subsp. lyrata]